MSENIENLKKEFFLSKYEVIRPLGDKKPENTWLVSHITTGKLFVKKQVDKDTFLLYQKRKDITNCHLVPIEYMCEQDGKFYVIEHFVSGDTLEEILEKQRKISEAKAIDYVLQILNGLESIHEKGIVHRDITPSNIIISTDGIVKIIDFGISRITDENKTKDTRILGTYGYAAPEQFGFAQTDARSDIYAVGSLLYRMIYGMLPNESGYTAENSPIGSIIQKAMRIDAEDRYQSAMEMEKSLLDLKASNNNVVEDDANSKVFFVPGFRTGKAWKMITAIFLYIILLIFTVSYIAGSIRNKNASNIRNFISSMLIFWTSPLLLVNIFNWTERVSVIKDLPRTVQLTIRVLVFFVVFIMGVMISTPIAIAK